MLLSKYLGLAKGSVIFFYLGTLLLGLEPTI
jgi:hypothetical protein